MLSLPNLMLSILYIEIYSNTHSMSNILNMVSEIIYFDISEILQEYKFYYVSDQILMRINFQEHRISAPDLI